MKATMPVQRTVFLMLAALSLAQVSAAEPQASEVIENSLQMKLVHIPPGEFDMGSPDSETGRKKEEKLHHVRITKGFYLGAHEVTLGQFRAFVKATTYRTEAEKDGHGGYGVNFKSGKFQREADYTWQKAGFPQEDNHPVVNVSWNDARAFCKWLSDSEEKTYRLPTEAEWEYACRAGTKTVYSSGDEPASLVRVANVADADIKAKYPAWTWTVEASDGHVYTAAVGQYPPNPFGLHDMHGNVMEWCADWHQANYEGAADPTGPAKGTNRVLRGGSFANSAPIVRSAARMNYRPQFRLNYVGFRVARD